MNKKISAFIAGILCAGICTGVSATEVRLKEDNRNIAVISGESNLAEHSKVTVSIFRSGENYDSISSFGESALDIMPFVAVTQTDAAGNWKIEWNCAESGTYDIYVSDGRRVIDGAPDTLFVPASMEDKINMLASAEKTELELMFSDRENLRAFVPDDMLRGQIKDGRKVGRALYVIRESVQDGADIYDYTELAAHMAALSEQPTAERLDSVVQRIEERGLQITDIETYTKYASASVKADMAKKLNGCCDMLFSVFDNSFTESLITSGVYRSVTWVDAKDFLDLLNNPQYNANKDKVARAVAGKDYTMQGLLAAISAAVENQNSAGGGGGGGGGGSKIGGGGIVSMLESGGETESSRGEQDYVEATVFTDVAQTHWAYDAINYLRWKEIVIGDENGRFNPEAEITRAEALKMMCCAYETEPLLGGNAPFEDVAVNDWFCGYVSAAKQLGIVTGDDTNCFRPQDKITREDLAVLIFRFAQHAGHVFDGAAEFSDEAEISEYAREAVGKMAGAGIINGVGGGVFAPTDSATRAQTAAIIYRLIQQLG